MTIIRYMTDNKYLNNKYLFESIGFFILFFGLANGDMCNLTNIRTHWFPIAAVFATIGSVISFVMDLRGDRRLAEKIFFVSLLILVIGKLKDMVFDSKEVFRQRMVNTNIGVGITIILVSVVLGFLLYATFYD